MNMHSVGHKFASCDQHSVYGSNKTIAYMLIMVMHYKNIHLCSK